MMKTTTALCLILCLSISMLQAQRGDWKDKMEAQKISFITQELDLSPKEAERFWPVYNEHQDKKRTLRQDRKRARDVLDLSEEEARQAVEDQLADEQALLDLKKEVADKYLDILPAHKVLALERAEMKFKKEMLLRLREHRGKGRNARQQKRLD